MNMPPDATAQHVQALAEVIRLLGPLLVDCNPSDVDDAIRLTATERGEERGVRSQVGQKLEFAHSVERGLEGLCGLSSLYTAQMTGD